MTRAIIVGAGFSGLIAAAALRDRVDEVIVLERDRLPTSPGARRGVPQSHQLHNLLGRAQLHAEELVPGFAQRLRDLGCGEGSVSSDTHVHELGIRMPERDLGLRLMCAPRPVIDHAIRSLVSPDVEILDATPVLSLLGDSHRVTGVIAGTSDSNRSIDADLVVDTSGPANISARWLAELGETVPTVERTADQWYVSTRARLAPTNDERPFSLVFPTWPSTRGGLVSPVGDGTHYISVSGTRQDRVPRCFADIQSYVAGLEDRVIARRLFGAAEVETPRVFRRQTEKWNRFDSIRLPIGLLPIGDAVATLNPLFGQGMSCAAWQASALARLPIDEQSASDLANHCRDVVESAWSLGQTVSQSLVMSVDGRQIDLAPALAAQIRDDPVLHERYVRIWHLLEPASLLSERELVDLLLRSASEP